MSNFSTYTPHVAGRPGFAPVNFDAATEDNLATITATGYLNDLGAEGIVKRNDRFLVNYLVDPAQVPPATPLTPAILAVFRVEIVGTDFDLVAFP